MLLMYKLRYTENWKRWTHLHDLLIWFKLKHTIMFLSSCDGADQDMQGGIWSHLICGCLMRFRLCPGVNVAGYLTRRHFIHFKQIQVNSFTWGRPSVVEIIHIQSNKDSCVLVFSTLFLYIPLFSVCLAGRPWRWASEGSEGWPC